MYIKACKKYGGKDIWSAGILPKEFSEWRDEAVAKTNTLLDFFTWGIQSHYLINDLKRYIISSTYTTNIILFRSCTFKDFKTAFNKWSIITGKQNRDKKGKTIPFSWKEDNYLAIFQRHQIEVKKGEPDENGRVSGQEMLVGIGMFFFSILHI